jgi:hypothetical protein
VTDADLKARLLALAPPMENADALAGDVRQARRRQQRRRMSVAAAGAAAAVIGVAGVVVATRDEPAPVSSLRPACGFPPPFTGFTPGSDDGTVTRTRGNPPTRLVAHAGRGDFRLENLRVEVLGPVGALRTVRLGTRPADGAEIAVEVGDAADDGRPIAPGRYAVVLAADVTGTNNCGEQARQHIDTTAGYLVVR